MTAGTRLRGGKQLRPLLLEDEPEQVPVSYWKIMNQYVIYIHYTIV